MALVPFSDDVSSAPLPTSISQVLAIGRGQGSGGNHLLLTDTQRVAGTQLVSRKHAEIALTAEGFLLRQMSTTSHSFVEATDGSATDIQVGRQDGKHLNSKIRRLESQLEGNVSNPVAVRTQIQLCRSELDALTAELPSIRLHHNAVLRFGGTLSGANFYDRFRFRVDCRISKQCFVLRLHKARCVELPEVIDLWPGLSLGRSASDSLVVLDSVSRPQLISKNHATVFWDESSSQLCLRNHGVNRTRVGLANLRPEQSAPLAEGCAVVLGSRYNNSELRYTVESKRLCELRERLLELESHTSAHSDAELKQLKVQLKEISGSSQLARQDAAEQAAAEQAAAEQAAAEQAVAQQAAAQQQAAAEQATAEGTTAKDAAAKDAAAKGAAGGAVEQVAPDKATKRTAEEMAAQHAVAEHASEDDVTVEQAAAEQAAAAPASAEGAAAEEAAVNTCAGDSPASTPAGKQPTASLSPTNLAASSTDLFEVGDIVSVLCEAGIRDDFQTGWFDGFVLRADDRLICNAVPARFERWYKIKYSESASTEWIGEHSRICAASEDISAAQPMRTSANKRQKRSCKPVISTEGKRKAKPNPKESKPLQKKPKPNTQPRPHIPKDPQKDVGMDSPAVSAHPIPSATTKLMRRGKRAVVHRVEQTSTIHHAIVTADSQLLQKIISSGNSQLEATCSDTNYTPLQLAAESNSIAACKSLVKAKANPNSAGVERDLLTPLHVAVLNGHTKVVACLLQLKANANSLEKNKATPLHLSAQYGLSDIVQLLCKANAIVDQPDADGDTALHYAACGTDGRGHSSAVSLLLTLGADPLIKANRKSTHMLTKDKELRKLLVDAEEKASAVLSSKSPGIAQNQKGQAQQVDELDSSFSSGVSWAQCDLCQKWRKLLPNTALPAEDTAWYCFQNKDSEHNCCEAEEERLEEAVTEAEEREQIQAEEEEKELAERAEQFAAGACLDNEEIDWKQAADSATDEREDAASDDDAEDTDQAAAAFDAAYLQLASFASSFNQTGSPDADNVSPDADSSYSEQSWEKMDGFVRPGSPGFNKFVQIQMKQARIPSNRSVLPPRDLKQTEWVASLKKPKLQPYQETVSWMCRPGTYSNPHMLVCHRVGAGKTATMIQIADNFINDKRPKIMIFPTTSVANNFYQELQNPIFPNRYSEYLNRLTQTNLGSQLDVRKALALHGRLFKGRVDKNFLSNPHLPSAPLRAFSYTQAGGAQVCGGHPNAVFRCPDGYPGYAGQKVPRSGGYPEFTNPSANPFSNKIILMDEMRPQGLVMQVHNLVLPSAQILRSPKRMEMLRRVRQLIRTAENSVIVGFTGTPLCDEKQQMRSLISIIKGTQQQQQQQLNDEGFISFYMDTPLSVFPKVSPVGIPSKVPASMIRKCRLRNFAKESKSSTRRTRPPTRGNREEYEGRHTKLLSVLPSRDLERLSTQQLMLLARFCSISQVFSYAGRQDVAATVHGMAGRLLRRDFGQVDLHSKPQQRRALGYCSKLQTLVNDVLQKPEQKTLVMVHRHAGWKLLLRMLDKQLGSSKVCGYPPARTWADKNDSVLSDLLGPVHDPVLGRANCACKLCAFNRLGGPLVMVADAMDCGEGVSFLGVRRLLLLDVPAAAVDYMQRVGRAVRFMGHGNLPSAERTVQVLVYQAVLPSGELTADQELIKRLRLNLTRYMQSLQHLQSAAFDCGCWEEDRPPPPCPQTESDADDAAGWATDEATDSESDEEEEPTPPPPPPQAPRQPPPKSAPHRSAQNLGPTEKLSASAAIDHVRATASLRYEAHRSRLEDMLGLQEDATFKQLKHSYRRTARLIHPDKCSSNGAEEAVKVLNNAFELVENETNEL